MARPKEGIGPSAQQRIEEAYWALLESMPHKKNNNRATLYESAHQSQYVLLPLSKH